MDPKEKDKGYSVGYKKPPQHTQFKPGQSGNPKGRPKKVPTTSDLFLKESLSRVPIITKDGRRHMISKMQAIAKQFATKAANGDYKAARLVLEQLNSGTRFRRQPRQSHSGISACQFPARSGRFRSTSSCASEVQKTQVAAFNRRGHLLMSSTRDYAYL